MRLDWSKLFRSEKAKVKPVLLEDVSEAEIPNKELEEQHDVLALRLMEGAVNAAIISGQIREQAAAQVALVAQGAFRR